MEAKDLMHNDLFMYGGELCRFVIRSMDAVIERASDNGSFPPCAVRKAEPIPLTPEILENNGFRESIEEGTYYFPNEYDELNNRGFAVETEGDNKWFITDHQLMVITSVHELQHALRLCSLNDLADNFKVV